MSKRCPYYDQCKLKNILQDGPNNPLCLGITNEQPPYTIPLSPSDSILDATYCPAFYIFESQKRDLKLPVLSPAGTEE